MSTSISIHPSTSTSTSGPTPSELESHHLLSLRLIDAILEQPDQIDLIERLILEERVDCWVQDQQGWTSLHAAAYNGNVELLKLLLRKGNAVWNLVDNLGCSAADIAYSMNERESYDFLSQEGVRSEMLRAVMEDATIEAGNDEDGDEEVKGEDKKEMEKVEEDSKMKDETDQLEGEQPSTTSSLTHYLSRPITFLTDSTGQEIALDEEGNGIMMGWERDIMRKTVEEMLERGWGDRKGKERSSLTEEEEKGEREELKVVNVGFGLGIIDTFFQTYQPTTHLIIEPHPSVLAHAKRKGWYNLPGVRFYEGTWQSWIKELEQGKEEWIEWDGIYFDTYSEHYIDLRSFLSQTPNLLSSSSPHASLSFFHGLGATSRSFYDVYTEVATLHLLEFGFKTEWREVEVLEKGGEWEATGVRKEGQRGGQGGGEEKKKYWEWEKAVGCYRLPICRFDY